MKDQFLHQLMQSVKNLKEKYQNQEMRINALENKLAQSPYQRNGPQHTLLGLFAYHMAFVIFLLLTILVVTAIFLTLDGYARVAALNIIAFALFISSIYCNEFFMRFIAYGLWLYSSIALLIIMLFPYLHTLLSHSNITCLTTFFIFALARHIAYTHITSFRSYEKQVPLVMQTLALLSILYWLHIIFLPITYRIIAIQSYALILYACGVYLHSYNMRIISYGSCLLSLIYFLAYTATDIRMQNNILMYNFILAIFLITFVIGKYILLMHKKKFLTKEYVLTSYAMNILIILVLYTWGITIIIGSFSEIHSESAFWLQRIMNYATGNTGIVKIVRTEKTNLLLMIYHCIFAVSLIAISMNKKHHSLMYIGFIVLLFGLYKALMLTVVVDNPFYRFAILIIVLLTSISGLVMYTGSKKEKKK